MSHPPLIVGHRGAADLAPENILQAFRLGLAEPRTRYISEDHLGR